PKRALESAFDFYQQISAYLNITVPFKRASDDGLADIQKWIAAVDAKIEVHQLRAFLQQAGASEETLQAILWIALKDKDKGRDDSQKSKLDFLLVQYLAHAVPSDRKELTIELAATLLS